VRAGTRCNEDCGGSCDEASHKLDELKIQQCGHAG
jgi:hypothetical protein